MFVCVLIVCGSVVCYVLIVRDGSPAAAAHVAAGDMLLAVDGIKVEKRSANAVVRLLQGPAHTEVEMLFQRSQPLQPAVFESADAARLSNLVTLRMQRCPLRSPDICIDFCQKISVSEAAQSSNSSVSPYLSSDLIPSWPSQQHCVGFGMNLKRDASGAFHVRRLDVGGPSAASRRITVGDECLAIDGVVLKGKSYSALSRLVLGPPSTTVELQMRSPRGGSIKKIMINRRSQAPTIPEEDGDAGRSSSRGTPDVAGAQVDERIGIGATFHRGRNGVFEVRAHARAHRTNRAGDE